MQKKIVKIYLTLSPKLVIEIFKKNILNKNLNLKNFYGLYVDTDQKDFAIINNLKEIKDYPTISYHIIRLAYRYKRLKISKNERKYYTLPFSENLDLSLRNTISTIDLIIKRFRINGIKTEVYLKKFQDKYINIFLSRYIKRKYNINLKFVSFGKIIKSNPQLFYTYKPYNVLSIFSIFKQVPFKNKTNIDKYSNKKILEVTSTKEIKAPYRLPKNNLSLVNLFTTIDFNDLYKHGLNKFESLLFISKRFIIFFKEISLFDLYNIFKNNLFVDYFQININKLYINNILIFLNKINIKYLFCSHRSFNKERLIYIACRLANVKSIAYDFSLGYPLRNTHKKEISLITYPDIFIVNSTLRQDHYKIANWDYIKSGNRLEIINCSCIQVEYSRKKAINLTSNNVLESKKIISIFDNNYGENLSIRLKYTKDLAEILSYYRNDLSCIVHSKIKYFYLENELKKHKISFSKALKGDFNLSSKSDIIISIGFQGAAIKAAFAFKKPIVFFSSDENYFSDLIFSNDSEHNEKVLKEFQKLIFNKNKIESLFLPENSDKNLKKIKSISIEFLELIGISENIPSIFSYLADLNN